MIPGTNWIASGIRHEAEPDTMVFKVRDCLHIGGFCLQSRVKNPVQNPKTTPNTIASCSSDMSDPRTSGGLISAMYRGESMLNPR